MSWPPTAPGIAEKPAPGRAASTADVVWAISNPATQPMTTAPNAKACLRMDIPLPEIRDGRGITKRKKRRRVGVALFYGPQCLAPQWAGLRSRPLAQERHAANGDGRDQHRK